MFFINFDDNLADILNNIMSFESFMIPDNLKLCLFKHLRKLLSFCKKEIKQIYDNYTMFIVIFFHAGFFSCNLWLSLLQEIKLQFRIDRAFNVDAYLIGKAHALDVICMSFQSLFIFIFHFFADFLYIT